MSLELNARLQNAPTSMVSSSPGFSLRASSVSGVSSASLLAFAPPTAPAGAELELARQALERVFNLPSAPPPPPPAGLGARALNMLGNIGRLGLAFVAGRYLTSEGELNLAKDTGQIGREVTINDMRDASSAMARVGMSGEGLGGDWNVDQRTRFIVGAAGLERLVAGGRIGEATLRQAMNELMTGVENPRAQTTTPAPAPTPAPSPTPTPTPAPVLGPADAAGIADWGAQ
ncbi:MAG: hypothetical protein MEP57_00630, partial [Microvirga sp.]|nr:hypothetical protein [Microvirga sp.]